MTSKREQFYKRRIAELEAQLKLRDERISTLEKQVAELLKANEARWCGRHAVQYAMTDDSGSVAIKRLGNGADYKVVLFRTELSNVAEKTKPMPDEFINAEGNGITDAFIEYAMPLIGDLPKTEYLGGYARV